MGSRFPFLTDVVQVISILWASFFPCEIMLLNQETLEVKVSSRPNQQTNNHTKQKFVGTDGSVVIAKKQHPLATLLWYYYHY